MAPSLITMPVGILQELCGTGVEMVAPPAAPIGRTSLTTCAALSAVSACWASSLRHRYLTISGGARLAAKHLIDLGHVCFAYVAGAYGNANQARLRGFRAALNERGLDLPDGCVIYAGFGFEKGLIIGEAVLAIVPRPTAAFSDTDELATGVLHMAADQGVRAPEELSVVGYGDFRIAPMVSLITVRSTT